METSYLEEGMPLLLSDVQTLKRYAQTHLHKQTYTQAHNRIGMKC